MMRFYYSGIHILLVATATTAALLFLLLVSSVVVVVVVDAGGRHHHQQHHAHAPPNLGVGKIRTSSSASSSSIIDMMGTSSSSSIGNNNNNNSTINNPFVYSERFKEFSSKVKEERKQRRRNLERQATIKKRRVWEKLPKVPKGNLERISESDWERIQQQQSGKSSRRNLNWFNSGGGNGNSDSAPYSLGVLIDPSQYYDKWSQAYRMLGGYIDCDHDKSDDDSGDNNDDGNNNGNGNNGGGGSTACSRWMMWAAYVNPNYQGNGYYEYFGDNPTSTLDCHNPDSDWELLGVYRQEFYQYIEQISKHLWAIDEYEYVVALAGLAYMTDYDCFYVGADNDGNSIYAGVAPQPYGKFQMALYTDGGYCLTPDTNTGMTFDDFGLTSDIDLGSNDNGNDDDYSSVYEWWYESQEYTLENLNNVYEEFQYCTSCVDYPTYQDGYYIGDYGTDDDDLINQCWKFYSHDSFTCEAECVAMAHSQGTILSIQYGDTTFGKSMSGFYNGKYESGKSSSSSKNFAESKFSRLLANAFLTVSFLLFVATFLAFAVARRSRYRDHHGRRSGKSRRLLDDKGGRSSRSRRSSSKHRSRSSSKRRSASTNKNDGDGLFRDRTSQARAQSKSRSKSKTRSSSSRRNTKSGTSSSNNRYDPPRESSGRSKSRSKKSSSNKTNTTSSKNNRDRNYF